MDGERSIQLPDRSLVVLSANLKRRVAAVVLGLLLAAALVVVARRYAGALRTPLELPALLMIGVLTAVAAMTVRLTWLLSISTNHSPRLDRVMMIATSFAVVALGASLCLPGTPVFGMFLLVALLGVEESWAWGWYVRRSCSPPVSHPPSLAPRPSSSITTPPAALPHVSDTVVFPEEVTQQLTRSRAVDGTEKLSGWLRSAFTAGQRTGSIHVAFCPPFAEAPELEVEQIDGPDVRIKTAQLLPYGVRLELKLARVSEEPTTVLLQFAARTKA